MAYSELVKNFEKIRVYMREFYVYGFKSRSEYDRKSGRSYDNVRRRIESWMGEYMFFRQDSAGKNVFLTVDNRSVPHNPFYKAFKAKSFTDNDILLHFCIMDILTDGKSKTVQQIIDSLSDNYFSEFDCSPEIDDSTVRKKLKEYEELGFLKSEKKGKELVYALHKDAVEQGRWREALTFYSETDPVGVIGSYLLDKPGEEADVFSFKHHYLLHALDSEIICDLLAAIREQRCVELTNFMVRNGETKQNTVFPVKIFISTQSGRQYLLGYHYRLRRPMFFRLDNIQKVKAGAVEKRIDKYSGFYETFRENLWGVSVGEGHSLDHIEMTIAIRRGESFILDRLEREKRCGHLEMVDEQTCKITADVYDAAEMLPWIRTFIGRIVRLECSNNLVVRRYREDLAMMRQMYGGEVNAVQ